MREQICRATSLKRVKEIFEVTLAQWDEGNLAFNPFL